MPLKCSNLISVKNVDTTRVMICKDKQKKNERRKEQTRVFTEIRQSFLLFYYNLYLTFWRKAK